MKGASAIALAAAGALSGSGCGKKRAPTASDACDVVTSAAPVTHFCVDYIDLKASALDDVKKECSSSVGATIWIDGGGCPMDARLLGSCTKDAASGGTIKIYFYPDYDDASAQAGCEGKFNGKWQAGAP